MLKNVHFFGNLEKKKRGKSDMHPPPATSDHRGGRTPPPNKSNTAHLGLELTPRVQKDGWVPVNPLARWVGHPEGLLDGLAEPTAESQHLPDKPSRGLGLIRLVPVLETRDSAGSGGAGTNTHLIAGNRNMHCNAWMCTLSESGLQATTIPNASAQCMAIECLSETNHKNPSRMKCTERRWQTGSRNNPSRAHGTQWLHWSSGSAGRSGRSPETAWWQCSSGGSQWHTKRMPTPATSRWTRW